jgi:putative nicotinate phosphoribosyltransferase
VLEVTAPLLEAQLVETAVLNLVHFQSLIAGKAARCVDAAEGRTLVDFGLRRSHGGEAGLKVARSSHLAGFDATSNLLAGRTYGIPVAGTMAHSYVECRDRRRQGTREGRLGGVRASRPVISRCRVHKERNVLDHLPEAERLWVRRKLRAAWANPDAAEAEAALAALAGQLEKVNPDAAASLREGLAETLTVTRLGVSGSLLKTVMSTNPIESMIEIVREHARNVKHWQNGDMRLRWAAAGMLAAPAQFRRVKGYRQLPQLAIALHRAVGAEDTTTITVSA